MGQGYQARGPKDRVTVLSDRRNSQLSDSQAQYGPVLVIVDFKLIFWPDLDRGLWRMRATGAMKMAAIFDANTESANDLPRFAP